MLKENDTNWQIRLADDGVLELTISMVDPESDRALTNIHNQTAPRSSKVHDKVYDIVTDLKSAHCDDETPGFVSFTV